MRRTAVTLALAVLLALVAPLGTAHAAEVNADWGSVTTKKQVKLKKSCRNYRYQYEVKPPETGDWDLSIDVVDPSGKVVWFGYLWEGQFPSAGTEVFRLCSTQTPVGRYKLRATVSNQHGNDVETFRLPVAKFTLRK